MRKLLLLLIPLFLVSACGSADNNAGKTSRQNSGDVHVVWKEGWTRVGADGDDFAVVEIDGKTCRIWWGDKAGGMDCDQSNPEFTTPTTVNSTP